MASTARSKDTSASLETLEPSCDASPFRPPSVTNGLNGLVNFMEIVRWTFHPRRGGKPLLPLHIPAPLTSAMRKKHMPGRKVLHAQRTTCHRGRQMRIIFDCRGYPAPWAQSGRTADGQKGGSMRRDFLVAALASILMATVGDRPRTAPVRIFHCRRVPTTSI